MNFKEWNKLSAAEQIIWVENIHPAIVRNFICGLWCRVNEYESKRMV